MDQTQDNVVAFPAAARLYTVCSPTRLSVPDHLVPLYERAISSPVLVEDNRQEFAKLFRDGRTVRRAAVVPGGNPIGFALAVPVATFVELGRALSIDRIDAHVPTTIARTKAWALVLAVDAFEVRKGIGRALANDALAAMRREECHRVYVAVRAGADHWLHVRLLADGFERDGTTKDGKRVILSRKTEGLQF